MNKMSCAVLLPLLFSMVIMFGCKKGPRKEMVTEPTGERLERISVTDNPDIQKLMTRTITGKIEIVSTHPNPASLPKELRESYKAVTVVNADGKRVFVRGSTNDYGKFKQSEGKTVTFVGELERGRARYNGEEYDLFNIKKINEIK